MTELIAVILKNDNLAVGVLLLVVGGLCYLLYRMSQTFADSQEKAAKQVSSAMDRNTSAIADLRSTLSALTGRMF